MGDHNFADLLVIRWLVGNDAETEVLSTAALPRGVRCVGRLIGSQLLDAAAVAELLA